jgi:hypothetical protein
MASGDFNNLVLRKATAYNPDGSYIKDGYVFTVSSNGKQNWTSDLKLNNLVLSTFTLSSQLYAASSLFDRTSISSLAVSSFIASSLIAGKMFTADIIACTINASTFFFPSVSLQSIYASSMSNNSFTTNDATASTLRATNLFATNFTFSTLAGSTMTGDIITASTMTMKNGSYSTLIGSTLSANTAVFQSTLLGSTVNAINIGYSTLIGSTLTSNTLAVQSTITGSTINAVSIGYSRLAGSTLTMNTGIWNSTLTGSTLLCSTVSAVNIGYSTLAGSTLAVNTVVLNSTLIGSTVNAVNVTYSTIQGSTTVSNVNTVLSILTASTITSVNVGCSTLSANTVIIPSTLVVSSLSGSTMTMSTLGVAAITSGSIGFSTLSGSTIAANVLTVGSTITASSLNAINIGYSTLQGNVIQSQSITASTMTGSTINFANLSFSTLNASTITADAMFPLSLQGSTMNVSNLLTASYVGIGTAVSANHPLTVSNTAFGTMELNHISTIAANDFYAAGTVYTVTDPTGGYQFKGKYAYAFGGAKTLATTSQSQAAGYYAIDVANAGLFGSDTTGAATGASFYMDSTKTYFQNTSLGIGTTSPGWPLTVAKDIPFAAMTSNPFDAALVIKGQSNTGTLKIGTYYTGVLFGAAIQSSQFSTGVDTPSALILNPLGGNVGVGTTNPSTALHVIGGVTASGSISSGGTVNSVGQFNMSDALIAANGIIRITTTAGVNSIQSGLTSASDSKADLVFGSMLVGTEWMRIKSTGNVGIGTNAPSNLLSIFSGSSNTTALSMTTSGSGWGSGIRFVNTSGRTYGVYSGSDGSLYVTDVTAGANRITINPAGDITLGSVRSFTFTIVVSGSGYNQVIGNTRIGNPLYVTSGIWAISVNATTITTTPVDLNPISANAYVATNIDVPTYAKVYNVISTSANMTITGGASGGATTGYGIFLNITNPAAHGTYNVNFLRVN